MIRLMHPIPGLILLMLCLVSISASAQWADWYGLAGGIGQTRVKQINENSFDFMVGKKTGGHVTAFAEKQLNQYIGLRYDMGYMMKGYDITGDFDVEVDGEMVGKGPMNYVLHSVGLNLNAKLQGLELKADPYLILGVGLEYMVSVALDAPNLDAYWTQYWTNLAYSGFNRFAVVGDFGIGCDFNDGFFVEVVNKPAFTNLTQPQEHETYGFTRLRVNYYGVTIGYKFRMERNHKE